MSQLLMQTKLHRPPLRPSIVPRPRLLSKLKSNAFSRLMLVSAPAGYGKTTFINSWLEEKVTGVAWLSLDDEDNSLVRFFTYLVVALQNVESSLGTSLQPLLQLPHIPDLSFIITTLINGMMGTNLPITLVLDDYHVVTDGRIHDAMALLLMNMPPNGQIILITREDPPFPLAKLRSQGHMTEIRQKDLRFTSEEVAEFLENTMNLDLSTTESEVLEKKTEGWIAGLQMAALSLKNSDQQEDFIQAFAGNDSYIADYLIAEIIAQQSIEVKTFLLQTAALDQFNFTLCNWLTEQNNGRDLLTYLEQANLFLIPLDNQRVWYRYHPLFRDLLRKQAKDELGGTAVSQLHLRAAKWFKRNNMVEHAIYHFLAGGEIRLATKTVEENAFSAIKEGRVGLVQNWLNAVPKEQTQNSLRLQLDQAWLYVIREQHKNLALCIDNAKKVECEDDKLLYERAALATLSAAYQAYNQGQNEVCLHACQNALADLDENDPFIRSWFVLLAIYASYNIGYMVEAIDYSEEAFTLCQTMGNRTGSLWALGLAGRAYYMQANSHELNRLYQRLFAFAQDDGWEYLPYMGTAYQDYGLFLYQLNKVDEAEKHLKHGIQLNKNYNLYNEMLEGCLHLRYILWAKGVSDDRLVTDEAINTIWEKLYARDLMPEDLFLFHAFQAEQWIREGRLLEVEQWVRQTAVTLDNKLDYPLDSGPLALARFYIVQKKELTAVVDFLQTQAKIVKSRGHTLRLIEVWILLAQALYLLGQISQAETILQKAVETAAPSGFVRLFVDAGQSIRTLLMQLQSHQDSLDLATQNILAAFPKTTPSSSTINQQEMIEPLSQRELEVLQLMADGLTNPQIAADLVIAVSTVKTHVNRIFAKLDSPSRIAAVNRARNLNLIQ